MIANLGYDWKYDRFLRFKCNAHAFTLLFIYVYISSRISNTLGKLFSTVMKNVERNTKGLNFSNSRVSGLECIIICTKIQFRFVEWFSRKSMCGLQNGIEILNTHSRGLLSALYMPISRDGAVFHHPVLLKCFNLILMFSLLYFYNRSFRKGYKFLQ